VSNNTASFSDEEKEIAKKGDFSMELRKTRKCLFLSSLLLLFLVFLECFFRFFHLAPSLLRQPFFAPVPDLPYLFTPHYVFEGRNRTDEFDLEGKVNSLGFLDEEWSRKKAGDEFRIIFLGDSFTSGIARKNALAYSREVERILQEKSAGKVNLLNMGVGGFFPEAEVLVLEKYGLSFQPDALLVNFIDNDVVDTHHGLDSIRLGPSGLLRARHEIALGFWTPLYLRSHFARWLLKILILDRLPYQIMDDDFSVIHEIQGKYRKDWEKILAAYSRMAAHCRRLDIPFFLVRLCQPENWKEKDASIDRYFENFCRRENIVFISLREALADLAREEKIYYSRDGHYRDNANRVIARKVASVLQEILKLEK
jgi:hypothetical protein